MTNAPSNYYNYIIQFIIKHMRLFLIEISILNLDINFHQFLLAKLDILHLKFVIFFFSFYALK